MPRRDLLMETPIVHSPRVQQIEGIFDVPSARCSATALTVTLDLPDAWNVGLIVGPSGSGKTTIARAFWPEALAAGFDWPSDRSVVDAFPAAMSIKDVTDLLCSVGFSSPPAWLRPFRALSNGEQFRVTLARVLAEKPALAVIDEFTSVVDRTVAKIASAALQRCVRRRKGRVICCSCHYDVAEWLEPDWIYEPETDSLSAGRSLRRPSIRLEVRRVHRSAWSLFRRHHYLSGNLHQSARCFLATWEDRPVAFAAVQHLCHPRTRILKREHRVVCLPDFQGVGIGNALSAFMGSMMRGMGYRYLSITSHPGMIRSRARSPLWRMTAAPNNRTKSLPRQSVGKSTGANAGSGKTGRFTGRLRASFEYVGPALARPEAESLWHSGDAIETATRKARHA